MQCSASGAYIKTFLARAIYPLSDVLLYFSLFYPVEGTQWVNQTIACLMCCVFNPSSCIVKC